MRRTFIQNLKPPDEGEGAKSKDTGLSKACITLLKPVFTEAEKNNIEKSPAPFCIGNKFYVPLERLLAYPKVNRLCENIEVLKALLPDSVVLNSDGSALKVDLLDEEEIY